MADFEPCITFTLKEEGGYCDVVGDGGHATNRGITQATLSDVRGHPCSAEDVQALGLVETKAIYASRYWNAVRGHDLPPGVDLMVFDFGVNAGVTRSARLLQHAVGADTDGYIGKGTIEETKKRSAFLLIAALSEAQQAYYESLDGFAQFGKGWSARTARRRAAAVAMIQQPAPAPSLPEGSAAPVAPAEPAPTGWAAIVRAAMALLAAIIAMFKRG